MTITDIIAEIEAHFETHDPLFMLDRKTWTAIKAALPVWRATHSYTLTGGLYELLQVCKTVTTSEAMSVNMAVYKGQTGTVWARPLPEFRKLFKPLLPFPSAGESLISDNASNSDNKQPSSVTNTSPVSREALPIQAEINSIIEKHLRLEYTAYVLPEAADAILSLLPAAKPVEDGEVEGTLEEISARIHQHDFAGAYKEADVYRKAASLLQRLAAEKAELVRENQQLSFANDSFSTNFRAEVKRSADLQAQLTAAQQECDERRAENINLWERLNAARADLANAEERIIERCAVKADEWATDEQREFGSGGPAAAIRALPRESL